MFYNDYEFNSERFDQQQRDFERFVKVANRSGGLTVIELCDRSAYETSKSVFCWGKEIAQLHRRKLSYIHVSTGEHQRSD